MASSRVISISSLVYNIVNSFYESYGIFWKILTNRDFSRTSSSKLQMFKWKMIFCNQNRNLPISIISLLKIVSKIRLDFVDLNKLTPTPMFHFYFLGKHQKIEGFLTFSGGIKIGYWCKKGSCVSMAPWKY